MKRILVFFLSFSACTAWADQITLKNGDRVTGAIVKKDGGNLTIKTDLMGVVTVAWDQVTDIKTAEALNVVLTGSAPAAPPVKATIASNNGQITLTGAGAPQTVAPTAISAIRDGAEEASYERLLHPGLLELWKGSATLGLAGTAGNSVTSTFNFGINAARVTNHDSASVYFNAVKASSTVNGVSSDTAQAVLGGWKYARDIGPRIAIATFNDYGYDKFQNLNLRFVLGGGLNYRAWKGKKGSFTVPLGIDYDHDKFGAIAPSTVGLSRASGEFFWGDDFAYAVTGTTSLTESFRMFNNLSIGGAYRANFDAAANVKLHKWLVWTLGFSERYLSDPSAGRKPNDVLYTTGIGATFGH